MKVTVQEISVKNFLSIGNKWISIDFRKGLYRVTGKNLDNNTNNGVGKSALLIDALIYGFFGKPVRKINLPDIPNTINNHRGCEVKLKFATENKNYMIHRGVAPGFLKLYENYNDGDEKQKNNEDEIQDSAKKFTQKRIDELIKSNFNTFSHMLIMSNSYTAPFLDLDSKNKKEIIENILGISIFGDMNKIATTENSDINSDYKISQKEYDITNSYLKSTVENYDKLKEKSKNFELNKKEKIEELTTQIKQIENNILKIQGQLIEIDVVKKNITSLTTFKEKKNLLNQQCNIKIEVNQEKISELNKNVNKLEKNNNCPVCNSETNSNNVKNYLESLTEKVANLKNKSEKIKIKKKSLLSSIKEIDDKLNKLQDKVYEHEDNISQIEKLIKKKQSEEAHLHEVTNTINQFDELINEEEIKLKKNELNKLKVKLKELLSNKKYIEYIRKLLSNEGIKNYIIKKILKFWNYKVNFYLNKLNAEFSIKFDESLEAIIKSRNRDELQYHSFSGGEKARIDVAILLSIIDISKIQNSIDLNVMVIDELLDGGLDDTGREDVLNLFKEMVVKQDKSIYVISHNQNLPIHLFTKEITLYKENGFTHL